MWARWLRQPRSTPYASQRYWEPAGERSGLPGSGSFGEGGSGSNDLSPCCKGGCERPARGGGGGKGQRLSTGKGMAAGVFDSLSATGYIEEREQARGRCWIQ